LVDCRHVCKMRIGAKRFQRCHPHTHHDVGSKWNLERGEFTKAGRECATASRSGCRAPSRPWRRAAGAPHCAGQCPQLGL
jgi:hypothetical protein